MDNTIHNFYELSRAKGLKIVHLNIRSLPRKIEQLRAILLGSNIDVITLSETWLHSKIDSQMIEIQGYTLHRLDRATQNANLKNKRGGGLLAYVRTALDVYVQTAECLSNKDIEIQWIKIKKKNTKTILLANIYRPPTGKVEQAIKVIEKGLAALRELNDEIVILGDFNIDYKNKMSINYRKLKFFERSNSLDQQISTTTRNTLNSSSLLDIVFTNMKFIKEAGTLDSFLSDHQPVFLLKKKRKNCEKSEQRFEGRSYRLYNKQEFINNITSKNWKFFFDASDPTEAWNEMLNIITEEANRQCPVRSFKIRNTKPSWLTNELIEQMKDRDYFYNKAKNFGHEDDWNIAKFHRNQVNFNVRRAKADYIKDQLRHNEGNSAKFWRTIKQIMPHKKGSIGNAKITIQNEGGVFQDKEAANLMNTYFASLGAVTAGSQNVTEIDETIDRNNSEPETLETPNSSKDSNSEKDKDDAELKLELFSENEVKILVDKINISKSSGISLLSSKLLKDSFQALIGKLTYLFNFSITSAIFPTQWKEALVIPIPKVTNPTESSNYRPISLLPLPGKILEKLVHNQLSFFLEENNLLSDNQFGFRKQRSTAHAVSQVLNQIYTNINRSAVTVAIYLDVSKAFNSVQHVTLLSKLRQMNLSQNALLWITSYLENRKQRTLVNSSYSNLIPVQQGVPQGSVLGPLFYIIYANDIAREIKASGYTFYADDTVLYTQKKDLFLATKLLQNDLHRLSEWCLKNDVVINAEKTKVMFFGSKVKIESMELPDFYINGANIERAKTYTYLGIKLDEQLTLDTHANCLIKRVSNKIYQLKRIRSFITKKAALLIYKNMILPILEYGDIFLHSASQKVRKKLQILQNKALKCALEKDKYFNTDDLHQEAKLMKLNDRRHVHVLLHMFQLAQMPNFKLWKAYQPTGTRTRSSKKKLFTSRRPTNEKYKKSITYQGPKLWNYLPGHIQKLDTYHEFKKEVKQIFQLSKTKKDEQSKSKSKSKSKPKPKSKPQIKNPKPKIQKPKLKLKPKPKPKPKPN